MNADFTEAFQVQLKNALNTGSSLAIEGSGGKRFYGRPAAGEPLSTVGHCGVLLFEPTELVLKARCGTPLAEIEALLAEHGQMLGFEPPHFGGGATLGGAIATGLSGPRRAFAGSTRDHVLGCTILNGRGEVLAFGGQVMKNVAGFDVSRLMVGAFGTLGLLLDITVRVLPRPEREMTLVFDFGADEALTAMNRWRAESWPLSGLAFDGAKIHARLAGSEDAVAAAARRMGGELLADGDTFWADLREQRHGFFSQPGNLWHLSVAPASERHDLPGAWFFDWGGALRWLKTDDRADNVFAAAAAAGGHASLFRGESGDGRVFQPLPAALHALHSRIKQSFDPENIFNPGRMYEDF